MRLSDGTAYWRKKTKGGLGYSKKFFKIATNPLNLDIIIIEGTFVYKLFGKRDCFPFSIVRMSHIESIIPHNVFYSAIKGGFLRIASSTLCLRDFISKTKDLLEHMKQQGSKSGNTGTSLRKIILAHSESFQHFSISLQDLLNFFPEDKL